MAYDHELDVLRTNLLAAISGGEAEARLHTLELWDRYLTSIGVTGGTLLDRMAKDAAAQGIPLTLYQKGDHIAGDGLGPELAPSITGGDWTVFGSPSPVSDGTGLHMAACPSNANCNHAIAALEDNKTYRCVYTVSNYTAGSHRVAVYGDTSNHGQIGTTNTGAGEFSQDLTTNQTATLLNQVRFTMTQASNTYDITALSIKEVL